MDNDTNNFILIYVYSFNVRYSFPSSSFVVDKHESFIDGICGKGLFELDTLVPQMERHLKGREKMKEKEKTTVNSLVDFLY